MSSSPRISVLMPCFRQARYLSEAIESVLAQEGADWELLISDDASNDGSAEIIRSFAGRDSRVRYQLHSPNLGMVANWNWCLQNARGEYIKYIFGDDCFSSKTALSQMARMLDNAPSASLAASSRFTLDENSNVTGIWDDLATAGLHDGSALIARCLRANANLVGEPSVVLFRRAQARRGFSPLLRQIVDLEMWFHLLLQGDLVYSPEPLCCFRQHGVQQTVINRETQTGDLEMVHILREYLSAPNNRLPHIGATTRKRIFFRTAIQLAKKNHHQPGHAIETKWLRSHLPVYWRIVCWLWYRAYRPFENLGRAENKRRLRRKAHVEYVKQTAFIKGLRQSRAQR